MHIPPFISTKIRDQFPQFYREENSFLIEFVEAYYEWMEAQGNPIGDALRLVDYADIDRTLDEFIIHFQNAYLYGMSEEITGDKRFLIKHILDVYRAKGSVRGFRLLFRLLYNEDINIYLPSKDILRASDGVWTIPRYIEVSDNEDNIALVGKRIKGASSGAEAIVQHYVERIVNQQIVRIYYLSNISGANFEKGEKIFDFNDTDYQAFIDRTKILGSVLDVEIVAGGQQFNVGDIIKATQGSGVEAEFRVASTANASGTLLFTIVDGGTLFSIDAKPIITRRGGIQDSIIANGGIGYSNTDTLYPINSIESGSGFVGGLITNSTGGITTITISNNGFGYTSDTLLIPIRPGQNASLVATINATGNVASVLINAPGSKYQNNIPLNFEGSGSGAAGTIQTNGNGSIISINISSGGSGYISAPTVTPDLTSNGSDAFIQANVALDGAGGSFNISSLVNTQILTFNTDLFSKFMNLPIHDGIIDNIIINNGGSNYSNGENLIFTPAYFISHLEIIDSGLGYSNDETVFLTDSTGSGFIGKIVTGSLGDVLAVDIFNPGRLYSGSVAIDEIRNTANTDVSEGSGVSFIIHRTNGSSVINAGSGTIETNGSGSITGFSGFDGGEGYHVAPVITVNTVSGSSANLTANIDYDYGVANTPINFHSQIIEGLNFETKTFGTIASLGDIVTGNNYTQQPKVIVRDFINTANLSGNIYFANTSNKLIGNGTTFETDFVEGDYITIDANPGALIDQFDYRIIRNIVSNTELYVDDIFQYTCNGNITGVSISNPGTGYVNNESLTVGGPGSGAIIRVKTDDDGAVIDIEIVDSGSGYYTIPTLSGGSGSSGVFIAQVIFANYKASYDLMQTVYSSSFYTEDDGSFGGSNEEIIGEPLFGAGIIKTVETISSGFGYQSDEFITMAAFGAISNIVIEDIGSGYTNGDLVIFSGGSPVNVANGVVVTHANGSIANITLVSVGSGYNTTPSVNILSNTGNGAELTASIEGLNTTYRLTGYVNERGQGKERGRWKDTRGFLNSDKYIQDSFYYQEYSYEIQAPVDGTKYTDLVKKIYHPAGNELFTKVRIIDKLNTNPVVMVEEVLSGNSAVGPGGNEMFSTSNTSGLITIIFDDI